MDTRRREQDTTAAWTAGQEHLASLSTRSTSEVVSGAAHQIPSDDPQAVVAAVQNVLNRPPVTQPGHR